MTAWTWRFAGFDPDDEGRREALCTLGNGYLATRGAMPESVADGVHYPGTYVAGGYNRVVSEVDGHRAEHESMVNLPNWLWTTFTTSDGGWFSLDHLTVVEHSTELDLRRGVLLRRALVRDRLGHHTEVRQRRIVHMGLEHVAGLETTIVPQDWGGELVVRSGLDGRVRNCGVSRYRDLESQHLQPVSASRPATDVILLVVETNQSHIRVAQAARTLVHRNGVRAGPGRTAPLDDGRLAQDFPLTVDAGDVVTVHKTVTLYTSRDRAISEPASAAVREVSLLPDFETLLVDHVRAWNRIWDRFTLDIATDGSVMRIVRLHVFHLMQTLSPHTIGRDAGVPARGLHGEAYRGHVFWDELFVLPVLVTRFPAVARSVLEYRYRRLPEARRAAAAVGYAGAMYPWQSGSDGRDETQKTHLNPLSGRWVQDATHRQRHVGLAVAYNIWQYYEATSDLEFLSDYGAEMLFEIAQFFSGLAGYDAARHRYVIRGVVGPDEFHTGYPGAETRGIDNNAYTNVLAAWVFGRALDAARCLPTRRRQEVFELVGVQRADELQWEQLSRRMFVPFSDGLIAQFEGYERLRTLDWDAYRDKYGDLQRLDRILEAEGDSVVNYQVSKQADVLMLLYLFSPRELTDLLGRLGYLLDPATWRRLVDFYLARTTHGSTLSAVVHAWVLARTHRSEAMEHFHRALVSDVADIQGGTTSEGVHLAAMASSLDLLQRCFAGIEVRAGVLWFDPHWPESLGALDLDLNVRGDDLHVRVTGKQVTVEMAADGRHDLSCACGAEAALLTPGGHVRFGGRTEHAPAEVGRDEQAG